MHLGGLEMSKIRYCEAMMNGPKVVHIKLLEFLRMMMMLPWQ